jgi:hypothetical protein
MEETRWWLHPERRRCLALNGGTIAMNCPSLLPLYQSGAVSFLFFVVLDFRWPPPAHPIPGGCGRIVGKEGRCGDGDPCPREAGGSFIFLLGPSMDYLVFIANSLILFKKYFSVDFVSLCEYKMILKIFKQISDILFLLGSLLLALLLGWHICLVYIKVSCLLYFDAVKS